MTPQWLPTQAFFAAQGKTIELVLQISNFENWKGGPWQTMIMGSAAQIREKAHTRSVNKWKNWEEQLQPLRTRLEEAGIETG